MTRIDWQKLQKTPDELLDIELTWSRFAGATWRQLIESGERRYLDFVWWAAHNAMHISDRLREVLSDELDKTGYSEMILEEAWNSEVSNRVSDLFWEEWD